MSNVSVIIRRIFLVLLIFVFLFLCIVRLITLQIVEGVTYLAETEENYTATQQMIATRGQIFDSTGMVMSTNRAVYKVILQKAFLPSKQQNDVI